jgi:hypothetical protein
MTAGATPAIRAAEPMPMTPMSSLAGVAPPSALHSFITGMGERAAVEDLARLRIAAPLRLQRAKRPSRGCSLEILTPEGQPLGWLPREDETALEMLGLDPVDLTVRVAGIVPAFQRPRVQIAILLPESVAKVAPAA